MAQVQDGAVLSALGWGALAAASLVIGALLALARRWSDAVVGAVLAFGAGALISSVAFELAQQGLQIGSPTSVAIGLALGAVTFFVADRAVERLGGRRGGGAAGLPLALGSLLDGIPEQAVLGIGLATGEGVSVALLVAIFVSNLPEGIGSAADMRAAGKSPAAVIRLWVGVAVVCALATLGGYAVADHASGNVQAGIDGFAAGALLVMLVDSMVPEAQKKAGNIAGLATVLGSAVAVAEACPGAWPGVRGAARGRQPSLPAAFFLGTAQSATVTAFTDGWAAYRPGTAGRSMSKT